MRWIENRGKWDTFSTWEGRRKNFKASVSVQRNGNHYFVAIREKDDTRYNSLWENNEWKTLEEAQQACIDWIDSKAVTTVG